MKAATLDDSVGIFHLSPWKSTMFWVLLTSLLPVTAALQGADSLTSHTHNTATVDEVKARSTLLEDRPRETEAGPTETEAGPRETETGRRETEAGPRETEAGRRETEAGPRETEAGPRETETGRRETEAGRRETEAGPKETETGRRETEAGPRETEAGRRETEAGPRETETGRRKIRTEPGAKKKRSDVAELQSKYSTLLHKVSSLETRLVTDCVDAKRFNRSGPVTIYPPDEIPLLVSCDQDTDGGGWLVFQRRKYGSENFYRDWATYAKGFGDITRDFWLGLDNLHMLTSRKRYELRVDLMMFNGTKGFATFSNFSVSDSSDKYTLSFGQFTGGNAGDSLSHHNNRAFVTLDADNDHMTMINCAVKWKAGWWFKHCLRCNLNGLLKDSRVYGGEAVTWYTFDQYYSLKSAEMKMRPEQ